MWILKNISNEDGRGFCLLPGNEYQFGRKDCAILLLNDSSISRKHSIIKLEESSGVLTDFSKYGTTVNGKKVIKEVKLKDNDVIHFGQSQHKFRLIKNRLVVAISCISSKDTKSSIKATVKELGGEFVNEWNEQCTHLLMECVTFTIKAVCALTSVCPIVTPKYLEDFLKACTDHGNPIPKPEMYLPEISEPSLKGLESLFAPDVKRESIFAGKKFVFLSSKQFKRLSPAIKMAGGTAKLQENAQDCMRREFHSDDVMIITPEAKDEALATAAQKGMTQSLMNYLHESGLRAIKESEIGLAILHLSQDNYCNPHKMSDDSIAGTTSSQIIHDTVADFTSQWQMTSKILDAKDSKKADLKKSQGVLVDDSQTNIDKKRKRSSETSMYVTDTVAMDTTSAFQVPKRPYQRTSVNGENLEKKGEKKHWSEKIECNEEKPANKKAGDDISKGIGNINDNELKKEEYDEDEIEELANSILEDDDDDFGKDLFALDTEKQSSRKSRLDKSHPADKSLDDKSRITESQFSVGPNGSESLKSPAIVNRDVSHATDKSRVADSQMSELTSAVDVPVPCLDRRSLDTGKRSRVSDSQLINDAWDNRGDVKGAESESHKRTRVSDSQPIEDASESRGAVVTVKSEGFERSRVSDSQPIDEDGCDNPRDNMKASHKTWTRDAKFGERYRKTDAEPHGLDFEDNRSEMMVPLGFINSKQDKPGNDIKPDIDPDEPTAFTIVGFSDLIIRKEVTKRQPIVYDSNVKNFKKFRKAYFPGKDRAIPRIIGGRDLVVFENVNEEKEKMFAEFKAINEERQSEMIQVDSVFKMDLNNQHRKRRK